MQEHKFKNLHPNEFREIIRKGEWTSNTSGACEGFIQANVVILHKDLADDFKKFCDLNPRPCPCLEMLPAGEYQPRKLVKKGNIGDIRTDLPKYKIYRKGEFVEEVTDIRHLWTKDMVTFFMGCSFSFEKALQRGGIPIRNIEEGKNVSMYKTNIQCTPAGPFSCPMVVSMRPVKKEMVEKAYQITGQFTDTHGAPVHHGNPKEIGIEDLNKVDFGDPVSIKEGEVPVFWACGVTSAMAAISSKSELIITHSPGCMFVTDVPEPEIKF